MQQETQITIHLKNRKFGYDDQEFTFSIAGRIQGEDVCETAFHLTNAPHEILDEHMQEIANRYHPRRSVSVGDVIEVHNEFWQCESCGWSKLTKTSD